MKYYVSLHQNFIDIRSFLANVKSSGHNSIKHDDFKVPAPKPFLLENMLYYPVAVGPGNGGGVIGFMKAKVSDNGKIDSTRVFWLNTPEDILQTGIKLSPQSIKMLKTVGPNTAPFGDGHSWASRGFKCKSEDLIKSLALGYYTMVESRDMMESLCYSSYDVVAYIRDKRTPMADVYKKVLYYYETDVKSAWMNQSIGQRLAATITRTTQPVDESYVVKWRKPNKTSKWPYTLDHHWFAAQESPVATAHHSLASLMNKNSNKDQLMMNLPIFTNIRQLEIARKILEHFYSNLKDIMGPNSSKFGMYISMINDFEWPNGRYSHRKMTPDMFPVKACMALGVVPTFDASGQFVKFAPIANAIHENTQTIYIDLEIDALGKRKPEVSLLLAYAIGLLDLDTVEKLLGPVSRNGEMLKQDPTKIQLQISPNVVCCVPVNSANTALSTAMEKYGVYVRTKHPSIHPDDIMEGDIAEHLEANVTF